MKDDLSKEDLEIIHINYGRILAFKDYEKELRDKACDYFARNKDDLAVLYRDEANNLKKRIEKLIDNLTNLYNIRDMLL